MGDNPEVSSGCPLTIDWDGAKTHNIDLDLYDEIRTDERRTSKQQLRLGVADRVKM